MIDPSITIKEYAAKVDAHAAQVDAYSHVVDAFKYFGMTVPIASQMYPDPPPTPEGLTEDQIAAHCALHELLTPAQFWNMMNHPSVIRINKFWAVKGKQRFCCMSAQPEGVGLVDVGPDATVPWWLQEDEEPPQRGHIKANVFFSAVNLNQAWMAAMETTTEKLAAQIKKRPWWDRFLYWLADKLF